MRPSIICLFAGNRWCQLRACLWRAFRRCRGGRRRGGGRGAGADSRAGRRGCRWRQERLAGRGGDRVGGLRRDRDHDDRRWRVRRRQDRRSGRRYRQCSSAVLPCSSAARRYSWAVPACWSAAQACSSVPGYSSAAPGCRLRLAARRCELPSPSAVPACWWPSAEPESPSVSACWLRSAALAYRSAWGSVGFGVLVAVGAGEFVAVGGTGVFVLVGLAVGRLSRLRAYAWPSAPGYWFRSASASRLVSGIGRLRGLRRLGRVRRGRIRSFGRNGGSCLSRLNRWRRRNSVGRRDGIGGGRRCCYGCGDGLGCGRACCFAALVSAALGRRPRGQTTKSARPRKIERRIRRYALLIDLFPQLSA